MQDEPRAFAWEEEAEDADDEEDFEEQFEEFEEEETAEYEDEDEATEEAEQEASVGISKVLSQWVLTHSLGMHEAEVPRGFLLLRRCTHSWCVQNSVCLYIHALTTGR